MIAYESLEKLLSARDEKNCAKEKKLGQRHQVGHCSGQPDFVQVGDSGEEVKNKLPRI
jgi:hypothetical protein